VTDDKIPKRRNRAPAGTTTRLNREQIAFFNDLLPKTRTLDFATWYTTTHGPDGKMLSKEEIPEAFPLQYPEEEEEPK
jgi:hypothetical protein